MKKPKKLTLIKGHFLPEEAREILLGIFLSKIRFHEMKNFSSQERFGKDDKTAVKRIPALKKSIEKLDRIIKHAEKHKKQLTINSEISVDLVKIK